MTRTGQCGVLVVTTLLCGMLVAGCGSGVRTEGNAPAATPSSAAPSSAAPSPTGTAEMQKLVDDAASAAAAADSDAAADR